MDKFHKDINVFLSEINKNLVCSKKQKKLILTDIKESILDFAEEHNTDNIEDVYAHFGTAQEIAKQFLSETEPKKISKIICIRKVLIVTAAIIVLLVAITLTITLIDAHRDYNGTLTITEVEEIT